MVEGTTRYDVFLSYNWRDHGPVEEVARALIERGLSVFLDRWYLAAGRPWPRAAPGPRRWSGSTCVMISEG